MITAARASFLSSELFSLTLMATTQRAKLYSEDATDAERATLRSALREALDEFTPKYEKSVTDAVHLANIESLSKGLSASHKTVLAGGRLRIGSAQKALNLHLKYMWCLGRAAMPPHCPIDAIVLARVPGCSAVRWTKLDSIIDYEQLIRRVRKVAGEIPLAVWELHLYNEA